MAYLEHEWKQPSLTDFYLMQIAAEVRRVLKKNPNSVKIKDFEFEFSDKKTPAYQQELSKAVWQAIANAGKPEQ